MEWQNRTKLHHVLDELPDAALPGGKNGWMLQPLFPFCRRVRTLPLKRL